MKLFGLRIFLGIVALVAGASTFPTEGQTQDRVRVFAAASLAEPLAAILSEIDGADGVFASSGTLARQIVAGAPADIFISAHSQWTDYLTSESAVEQKDVSIFLRNALVLIGGADEPKIEGFDESIVPLLMERRLAIGDPDHVPAGFYARQALMAGGLWDSLERSAVRASSVRAALAYVERGAVGYGIVYASDAAASRASLQLAIPTHLHDPIVYTITLLRDTPAARAVLDTLKGTDSQATLSRFGFTLAPAD
ncbi:MAG: molybdate ABC transporter substrate-binding protein [Alphaproteobacteria bacterium]|nr:molybdate ABC transporter substrate-binding protein [Alphaproteobacteria bacterium]